MKLIVIVASILLILGNVNAAEINTYPSAIPAAGDKVPFIDISNINRLRLGTVQQMFNAANATKKQTKSISLPPTMSVAYTFLLWRTPVNITITNISGVCVGGDYSNKVIGGFDQVNSDGVSGIAAIDSDITFDGGLDTDDGALSNPNVAAGKWIRWHTTSMTGSPAGWTTISIDYTEN